MYLLEAALSSLVSNDDIKQQQADLQAKILQLLGSNAVVPSSSSTSWWIILQRRETIPLVGVVTALVKWEGQQVVEASITIASIQ